MLNFRSYFSAMNCIWTHPYGKSVTLSIQSESLCTFSHVNTHSNSIHYIALRLHDVLRLHFCVCVKHINFCNCLCSYSSSSRFSASLAQNIASHIRDFGPRYNVKKYVCFYTTSTSHQKTDSVIWKNNSSVKPRLSLEKSCLWSCAVQFENCA